MIESKVKKESDRKDKVIRALTIFGLTLLGLLGHAHYLLATVPSEFECHIPPDLSQGGKVMVNQYQKHEIYGLAFNLMQKLKRCEEDCAVEYEKNIRKLGHYFTDRYRQQLLTEAKRSEGYHRKKGRSLSEFGVYEDNKVVELGNETWVVYLDVKEKEVVGINPVRTAVIRYPIRVVRHDVDRAKNPWKLAFDGLDGEPRRLDKGGHGE